MRDYDAAEIVCIACGCVIAEKLTDMRPEWRAFDDEQKSKRTRVGAPVTFSVDHDEPIVIQRNGSIDIVKIGDFVDSQVSRESLREGGGIEYTYVRGYKAFCFNRDLDFGFRPIRYVSRHKVSDDLYELTLEDGGKVSVTGAHSVFVAGQNCVAPARVDQLAPGDNVIAPNRTLIPRLVQDWLGLDDMEQDGAPSFNTVAPGMESFPACLTELMDNVVEPKIKSGRSLARVRISEDLCKLLGFLAGGFVRNGHKRSRIIDELQAFLKNVCKIELIVCPSGSGSYEVPSRKLSGVLAGLIHLDSPTRCDSGDLPYKYKRAFLQGLNGSEPISLVGASDGIAAQLVTTARVEPPTMAGGRVLSPEEHLLSARFEFLRIIDIRRVRPTSSYAYDISVPSCENFLGGRAWIFLHNTIHDKGLSTVIDWRDTRSSGKSELSATRRLDLYKLRKWQRRVRVSDATERNLAVALSELSKLAAGLNLPRNILETASIIYRRAIKKRLIRGRSIHNVTAAAIYMACRQCGVPRTLDEISGASGLNKKDIGRSYRFMIRELETFVPPSTCRDYAARFSNKLVVSGQAEGIAIKILETARSLRLTSGRGPTGIAAAATYIATVLTNENKTQREIAEIANVTEVTIRNRYKELLEKLFIEVALSASSLLLASFAGMDEIIGRFLGLLF